MPLFEVYAALSFSFAFAIIALFEKVMRPGYEKKISLFEEALKEKYLEDLSKATKELGHLRGRDEIIKKIEEIAESSWGVRNKYYHLNVLTKLKFMFFLGWMAVLTTSILAIYSKETGSLSHMNWYGGLTGLFFSMLIFTISYVFLLLRFDHSLSKFEEEKRPLIKARSLRSEVSKIVRTEKLAEKEVIEILEKNDVPFKSGGRIAGFEWDLIIPNMKNPKFFVEIKRSRYPSPTFLYMLFDRSTFLKSKYPSCKVILITELEAFSARMKERISKYVNIFDLNKLEDFIKFVKSEEKSWKGRRKVPIK